MKSELKARVTLSGCLLEKRVKNLLTCLHILCTSPHPHRLTHIPTPSQVVSHPHILTGCFTSPHPHSWMSHIPMHTPVHSLSHTPHTLTARLTPYTLSSTHNTYGISPYSLPTPASNTTQPARDKPQKMSLICSSVW